MAVISKKPKRKQLSETDIDKLISKGGDVPTKEPAQEARAPRAKRKLQKKVSVQLRLPQNLIDQIDDILDNRLVNISRHTWFLEAIESKILAERAEA